MSKTKRQKSKKNRQISTIFNQKKVRSDLESDCFSDARDKSQSIPRSPIDHSDDRDTDFEIKPVKITAVKMDASLNETLAPSRSLLDVQPIITSTPSAT